MIANLPRFKISDLCDLIIDCVNKTAPSVKYRTPFKMIRTSNIKNGVINMEGCRNVTQETYEKWTRRSTVDKGDVLLTREAPMGEVGLVNFQDTIFLGQRIMQYRANPKKLDSNYLLYTFLSSDLQQQFRSHDSTGSIVSHIKVPDCSEFEITLPTLTEQKKISKILKDLDKKIEINNRINVELEKTAKTLYNYWFVQFDFPDKNGKPYKSSGGKMVSDKNLKSGIPEGWEMKKISDLFTFQKGIEPGASEYKDKKETNDDILFYRVGDIDGSSRIYVNSKNKNYNLVKEEDVIITFDGSVGKMGFGLYGAYSGGLQKIYDKTNKYKNALVYSLFKDERIIATIHQYATGSIILHASGSINYLKIPFKENIYLDFQKIINPIFTKLVKNKIENQRLAELRDWLLPMLMNGQVTVK